MIFPIAGNKWKNNNNNKNEKKKKFWCGNWKGYCPNCIERGNCIAILSLYCNQGGWKVAGSRRDCIAGGLAAGSLCRNTKIVL